MDERQGLVEEIKQLKQENQELRERLTAAEVKIKQLVELLNQHSGNSNWPSSRDKSRTKPKSKSQRQKTERKAGGQEGHEGHSLAINLEPDVIERYRPLACDQCRQPLAESIVPIEVARRQVLDLPPLRFVTTEHQAETVVCPDCGGVTTAAFPAEVSHLVQYGAGVKQLAVYLRTEQFIPYERSRQLLADLFELPIGTGSLQNFVQAAAEQVEAVSDAIKAAIVESEVAHADETGFYIGGQRVWLHTVSTEELSHFEPHAKRGQAATDEIGILPRFRGTLVHDAWMSYWTYRLLVHALCNAHHLRDLTAVVENDQQAWASFMITFLLTAKQLVETARQQGQTTLPADQLQRIDRLYAAIVCLGLSENPLPTDQPPPTKRGRPKRTKARNLVERFALHKAAILRFIHDFKVPFDNNLAERDIRMMKVQQKVSGCFRSWQGAVAFCRLRSYISTIRKQGLSVWEALGSLFNGPVLFPHLTPE